MTFKNLIKTAIFILVACIGLVACEKEATINLPPVQENVLSILPLGDSRVEGGRPDFESYRYELWKNLIANDWSIDFVGTRTDEGNYPNFNNQAFDTDHEGTGGAQTNDILETLAKIGTDNIPQIVLLGIGGNDLTVGKKTVAATIDNVNQIIEVLQNGNANVTIFLEQIAPGHSDYMTEELLRPFNQFNEQIIAVGNAKTTANSKVITINMAKDWSDDYMADEVHYNEAGAKVVADRYFEMMAANLEK